MYCQIAIRTYQLNEILILEHIIYGLEGLILHQHLIFLLTLVICAKNHPQEFSASCGRPNYYYTLSLVYYIIIIFDLGDLCA